MTPQDYAEAIKWYKKSADQGLSNGQFNLAISYLKGRGVKKDNISAHVWFNLVAANATDEDLRKKAVDGRTEVEKLMTSEQIAEAQKIAREWKPKVKN